MENFYLSSDIDEVIERIRDISTDLSGTNVLLTGGRGFLGRYFIAVFDRLNKNVLKKPVRVTVLDNFISSGKNLPQKIQYDNIKFIEHDVIQSYPWEGDLDYIIHAAGIASPFYYRAYPIETLEVAINGTQNMLELAKNFGARFSFFSSSEIYGNPDSKHVPTPESYRGNVSCQGPRACYDESKRAGETLCHIYHTKSGTATNTIRPFNVFGPGMLETDYRVLPNFASRIKSGDPLHIYGNGNQTRTFCYITDALTGFFKVFLRGVPGEAYNIGTPKPEISMIDLAEILEKICSTNITYDLIEYPDSYPTDEPMRRSPDIKKARLQLGYNPIVELEDGLSRFLSWADKSYIG